jgi:hypothetical protein
MLLVAGCVERRGMKKRKTTRGAKIEGWNSGKSGRAY